MKHPLQAYSGSTSKPQCPLSLVSGREAPAPRISCLFGMISTKVETLIGALSSLKITGPGGSVTVANRPSALMVRVLPFVWYYMHWPCAAGSRLPAPSLWPLLDMHPGPAKPPVSQPALPCIPEQNQPVAKPQILTDADPSLAHLQALNAGAASALMLQLGHEGCERSSNGPQDATTTAPADSATVG